MTHWITTGATSIGKAHIDANLPNQDSLFCYQDEQKSIAVVCDGAGSAKFSQDGSRFFANAIGRYLVGLGEKIAENLLNKTANTMDAVNLLKNSKVSTPEFFSKNLAEIRQQLAEKIPADTTLREYHATVTAVLVLASLNQALLIQIGDSPLFTSQFAVQGDMVDYFANTHIYGEDSKDEYVNETHFITEDSWQSYLKIEWLDLAQVDMIALFTDGCGDLIIEGGKLPKTVYRPFFANLLFNVLQSPVPAVADNIIETTLSNPATYRLTGDDKTLVVLVRQDKQGLKNLEPLIEDNLNQNLNQVPIQNPTLETTSPPAGNSVWQATNSNLPVEQTHVNNQVNVDNPANVDNIEVNAKNTLRLDLNQDLATDLNATSPSTLPISETKASTEMGGNVQHSALPPVQTPPLGSPLKPIDASALPTVQPPPAKNTKIAMLGVLAGIVGAGVVVGLNKERIFGNPSEVAPTVNSVPAVSSPTPTLADSTTMTTTASSASTNTVVNSAPATTPVSVANATTSSPNHINNNATAAAHTATNTQGK